MKEYKPDSYKKTPVPKISHTRSDSTNKRLDSDRYLTTQHKIEEMWEHMGLYDGKVILLFSFVLNYFSTEIVC